MKRVDGTMYFLLLVLLVYLPCCQMAGQELSGNKAVVDSLFSFHLNFVKECSEDSGKYIVRTGLIHHLNFLVSLTRINPHTAFTEIGPFYRSAQLAREDYENFSRWYSDNKDKLSWDPLHKLIRIEDPNLQTCRMSPEDIEPGKEHSWWTISIDYCSTWVVGSPCSLCPDSYMDVVRDIVSPREERYERDSLEDSIAGWDVDNVEIDDQEEILEFIKALNACQLSPRFEFRYMCSRIDCMIMCFREDRSYEVSFSNSGLMMLNGCVYDTDPRLLDLLAKYLPPDYLCPGE